MSGKNQSFGVYLDHDGRGYAQHGKMFALHDTTVKITFREGEWAAAAFRHPRLFYCKYFARFV